MKAAAEMKLRAESWPLLRLAAGKLTGEIKTRARGEQSAAIPCPLGYP